jgi:hypothetical protein
MHRSIHRHLVTLLSANTATAEEQRVDAPFLYKGLVRQ